MDASKTVVHKAAIVARSLWASSVVRKSVLAAVCLAACVGTATPSQAAFVLVFDNSSYFTTVNGTVTASVFFQGTQGESYSSLTRAATTVTFGTGTIAKVNSAADITANPSANSVTKTTSATTADLSWTAAPPAPADSSNKVLVGTFKFTGVGPGKVTITASDPSGNSFSSPTAGLLIPVAPASADITVTASAVPEPGSLALVGIAAGLMTGGAWWRRRRGGASLPTSIPQVSGA